MTKSEPREISSPVEGVRALERKFKSKAHGLMVTQRLYTCPNGLQLAAMRGGALHAADEKSWQVVTMDANGVTIGAAAGYVPNDQMLRLVSLLAGWLDRDAV